MIKIKRTYYSTHTSGVLTFEYDKIKGSKDYQHIVLYTLELPFKDNKNNISCIPEGKYILKKHISPKFKECFKLYQMGIAEKEFWDMDPNIRNIMINGNGLGCLGNLKEVNGRSEILIHSGNTTKDTQGCILVGLSQGNECVLESKKAMKLLLDMLEDVNELIIEGK